MSAWIRKRAACAAIPAASSSTSAEVAVKNHLSGTRSRPAKRSQPTATPPATPSMPPRSMFEVPPDAATPCRKSTVSEPSRSTATAITARTIGSSFARINGSVRIYLSGPASSAFRTRRTARCGRRGASRARSRVHSGSAAGTRSGVACTSSARATRGSGRAVGAPSCRFDEVVEQRALRVAHVAPRHAGEVRRQGLARARRPRRDSCAPGRPAARRASSPASTPW